MLFRGVLVLCLLACACARTVRAGEGTTNAAAISKIRALADEGRLEAMVHALETAEARPDDLRAQRKAAELVQDQLETLRDSQQITALYAKAQPMLGRLEAGPEACTTRVEAGRVRTAAEDRETAVLDFVTSARTCQSVPAFIQAGYTLRSLGRCPEVLNLAPTVFAGAAKHEWLTVFDTVASCSNAVTLRPNLSFAPEQAVTDYFALLQQREVQRREAAERAEKEAQARAAVEENRAGCYGQCDKTGSMCESTCGLTNPACLRRCRGQTAMCRSGCI